MRHRGPDGVHGWGAGPVGLGHALLRTTPESLAESLPLVAGPYAITADARIDNRDVLVPQLQTTLRELGLAADVVPDSSVVLAAYARWGNDCVGRLLGGVRVRGVGRARGAARVRARPLRRPAPLHRRRTGRAVRIRLGAQGPLRTRRRPARLGRAEGGRVALGPDLRPGRDRVRRRRSAPGRPRAHGDGGPDGRPALLAAGAGPRALGGPRAVGRAVRRGVRRGRPVPDAERVPARRRASAAAWTRRRSRPSPRA